MKKCNDKWVLWRALPAVLAGASVLGVVGCKASGNSGAITNGVSSIDVPLVPQSQRPERVDFLVRVELEDAEGRRVASIPIRYDFPATEVTLLSSDSASEQLALQTLQQATISSSVSDADALVVSVDRQAASSLLPLYGDGAELGLNALRFQVSRQAFAGAPDDLKLNLQSFYAGGRLVIGVWAEMYSAEGDWAGFHPAFDSWISVPLADVGQARLDEVVINVPALSQEIRQVLADRNAQTPGGSVDLEQIVPPSPLQTDGE